MVTCRAPVTAVRLIRVGGTEEEGRPVRGVFAGRNMPFHNGVYYSYATDTQGTRSSAGIPSLLNSPLSMAAAAAVPFRFSPRRERVDWRRISAVDIDQVMTQLDLDVLQEHIAGVTFCSLEGERCPRCQSPVDPALVKLLRLAQLTVEWLLHSQEVLALGLRGAEERVQSGVEERERMLAEQKQLEERVKTLSEELRQRKRMHSQKCLHCDKSFVNTSFLQSHMQRRHPNEWELDSRSDGEKKAEMESLKLEISGLKKQVVQQQLDLQAKTAQEKEQQSMHKELLRELDRFKAEEMVRMDKKFEDSRDGMRREMEFLYTRNIQALNEVNQNQTARHEKPASPVQSQPERATDNYREVQMQAIQSLEHQLKKQNKRLQEIKDQHETEKNQLLNEMSRVQASLCEQQESSQMLQQEMKRGLQDKEQTIKELREQIRDISLHPPPTKIVEVPVVVAAPAAEPKRKRVVLEEPASAPKMDPIQELSEEDKDSSSVSERKPVEKKPVEKKPVKKKHDPDPDRKPVRATSSTLKKNPSIKKAMQPHLEQTVIQKLEHLGVKPDQSGLKDKDFSSAIAQVHRERAKRTSNYWRRREELGRLVQQKLSAVWRDSDPTPEVPPTSKQSVQVVEIRPRSSSLPSRSKQVGSGPAARQQKTPQATPSTRTTARPKTSTPNSKNTARAFASKTPPFSSNEESEEDSDTDKRGKALQHTPNPTPVAASRASPFQARQAPPKLSSLVGGATKRVPVKAESDEEEWSEVSELQEVDPKRLQSYKDQNGNVARRNPGKDDKIDDLARKVETQLAERTATKPAGGVSVFPNIKEEVQELAVTDLEESSDSMVSSLEDRQEVNIASQTPIRRSLDSASTSVWGSSTGRAPRSGLTEAGTGSTPKSSMCTLSDLSESEDNSSSNYDKRYS